MIIRNVNLSRMMEILEELSKKCEKIDIELDSENNQVTFHPIKTEEKKDSLVPVVQNNKIDLSNITKLI